jgi:hypothetical protein
MARNTTVKKYVNFTKGLITEAEALTFPENASLDELNCVPTIKGNRKRRLGIDYENNYSLSTNTFDSNSLDTDVVTTDVWEAVGGNGSLNFLITQIGDTLYFNDLANEDVSTGEKTFTVDLTTKLATGQSDVGTERISIASGKGVCFVVSKKIDPFYISYDDSTDTITTTDITVEIRDFDGLDDGLEVDENPSSLSTEHEYNLRNQGWVNPPGISSDLITTYNSNQSEYPSNNQIWYIGKDTDENFSPTILAKQDFGNTPAPKGRFILNAFFKDRSTVSGVSGITTESVTNRPESVAFFAGRVFYSGVEGSSTGSNLYFSQIIFDNFENVGYCYQTADPTSENDSILADADGGVISIPRIGNIKKLVPVDRFLVIFADNGLWAITGTDSGFTAAGFEILDVSKVDCINGSSVAEVEGIPIWWSSQGIYTLEVNSITKNLAAKNLTENTIQTFYDSNITATAKLNAQGQYDRASKRVVWLYKEDDTGDNLRQYDRALLFDLRLVSFYPWKFSELSSNSPYPASLFNTTNLSIVSTTENVTNGGTLVTDGGVAVTDDVVTAGATNTFLKFLALIPTGSSSQFTFADLNNRSFVDWETKTGTGADFSSYIVTGYELADDIMRDKQIVYINTYLKRTEDVWALSANNDYVLQNQSSCLLQAQWQWADSAESNKWSSSQQVYRFRQNVVPDVNDLDFDNGFPVVITKNKLRGFGEALSLKFSSESGKDFDILGWGVMMTGETRP